MSLDSVLQQITKFSGVPAKFGTASRAVRITALVTTDGIFDLLRSQLLLALNTNGWNIVDSNVIVKSLSSGAQYANQYQVDLYPEVENIYSDDDVINSITALFNSIGATVLGSPQVFDIPIDNTHSGDVPVNNTGNNGTGGNNTGNNNAGNNNNNKQQGATPKPKGFFDAFLDPTTQKLTAVGIGVLTVIGLVVVTQKK